ncbi:MULTISPECIES: hypothetical protein [unclassified Modestobacter]|uniref:hypothetical protein n=1 Tax=unclassified Modestobacter TaxID=2643866 RepID=UPI0022AB137F|nr:MULTISPECIES: hypothetical protein [unclassified Modestobacter]MCZ2824475.1 hypothetical protein [Modestobacter sp. VKM Ac-2981]MCZ2853997.1 hypothetical protein [Modestobacter sp. VKM Ac-2982]
MTSISLPARRNRWRSAAAGVAIAAASFTMTACGSEDEGVEDTGVVEEGDVLEEEEDE